MSSERVIFIEIKYFFEYKMPLNNRRIPKYENW